MREAALTDYEILTLAMEGLLVQEGPAYNDTIRTCEYTTATGRHCAIGHCLTLVDPHPQEAGGVLSLLSDGSNSLDKYTELFFDRDTPRAERKRFLADVQDFHDSIAQLAYKATILAQERPMPEDYELRDKLFMTMIKIEFPTLAKKAPGFNILEIDWSKDASHTPLHTFRTETIAMVCKNISSFEPLIALKAGKLLATRYLNHIDEAEEDSEHP